MLFNPSFSLSTQDPSQTICYYFLIVTHLEYLKLSLKRVSSLFDGFRLCLPSILTLSFLWGAARQLAGKVLNNSSSVTIALKKNGDERLNA